jgi:hypothetical protein
MALSELLPFRQINNLSKDTFVDKVLDSDEIKAISRTMRIASLAIGYNGTSLFYNSRSNFEPAPYDFDRITQAVDTDSYVKQGLGKYKELFWKEGWKIVGENDRAVEYLYQRIDYMEMAMKRPFADFLLEVSDQLFKYGNVFIVKARGDISQYFPSKLEAVNSELPIVGYYLIPTEQVRILRDKHNRPKSYQQVTEPFNFTSGPNNTDPVWSADKVIHMSFDKKTGRAFGTPFLSSVLDDVIALRQIEEDIQNLVHRELFPLYKYIIGTPEQPAEPDEIDRAAIEIENLRAEGGVILPYRHDIEVIGSANTALDVSKYLEHFKERVAVGLGLSPHHLGMLMNGGNRSVTDRLDTALYDKVKQYQKIFGEMIRFHIFKELLLEGGFDPVPNPISDGESDRCYFIFNEIDVDTQVKKETHLIQKYVSSLITLPEARLQMGLDPEYDEDELFNMIQGRATMTVNQAQQGNTADPGSDKQDSAPSGQVNLPNRRRGVGNVIRPANQNGRNTSPDIRRFDSAWLSMVENLLEKDYNVIYTDEKKDS